jgi:hypothetical protein|tara:strand:+ start:497 stop:826 length:330 start_codon:yes stop_codon:yes gene_type:complete
MPGGNVADKSSTKSFGTQNASKSTDSFSIKASAIPVTLASLPSSKNVQAALEEISTQVAVQTTAPTGADVTEGDLWYDTDDDILFVRRDTSWIEMVQEELSGNIDGGSW